MIVPFAPRAPTAAPTQSDENLLMAAATMHEMGRLPQMDYDKVKIPYGQLPGEEDEFPSDKPMPEKGAPRMKSIEEPRD